MRTQPWCRHEMSALATEGRTPEASLLEEGRGQGQAGCKPGASPHGDPRGSTGALGLWPQNREAASVSEPPGWWPWRGHLQLDLLPRADGRDSFRQVWD